MTTPMLESTGFWANACVNYRYVGCRRLRPSPKVFLSFWPSLSQKKCAATHRTGSFILTWLRTFYRAEDYPPEPAISGYQEPNGPQTSIGILPRRGGAPDFLCPLKGAVPVR